jgi:hypothetical protein
LIIYISIIVNTGEMANIGLLALVTADIYSITELKESLP